VIAVATSAAAREMKGDDLSNIIIKGENRLRASARAPEMEWVADVYKEVPGLLENIGVLSDHTPPSIGKPPVVLPTQSVSRKTANPWLSAIQESPVLTLDLKGKPTTDPRTWTFLVKDSRGGVFYEQKIRSKEPPSVVWDGFGKSGPLHVGFDYTYTFTVVDEGGNAKRLGGKPFRIDAFRHNRGGGTTTLLASDSLFENRSSVSFSRDGAGLMVEVKDSLRDRADDKVEIIAYEADGVFAGTQANAAKEFLMKTLDWPENRITAQGLTLKEGGYPHVQIKVR
jgi:hypothetical protein